MSCRSLDPDKIVRTLERARAIAKPNELMRLSIAVVVLAGIGALAYVAGIIEYKKSSDNLFGVLQGIEALMNIVVLMGAAIFFLSTLESRWKRQRAISHLHELRTIVHVIDMHQLTKDPSTTLSKTRRTPSSPKRTMSPFELVRYLDYCSEMYSLTAKVATLYAQSSRDSLVISTVTEIEQVAANLSAKVWQKITMIRESDATDAGPRTTPVPANEA